MNPLAELSDRFRIDEMLGRRALTRAFRATDLQTGNALVLKAVRYPVWFSAFERQCHQRRAVRSLQAAAEARHPACASVVEVSEGASSLFMTREWVDGRPLSSLLRENGCLPPGEVARIAQECSGAIDSFAQVGSPHGSLTADNLILRHDGTVLVTDARFAAEVARFDLAGARCGLDVQPLHGSDISALAEILLTALGGLYGPDPSCPTTARMVRVLRRAMRDRRAYASASSLADALSSLDTAGLVRQVWRPATSAGLMAAFGTVCMLALSDEKPATRKPAASRPTVTASAPVRTGTPTPATEAFGLEPTVTMYDELSDDEKSWLGLVVRRQGVGALSRPAVAQIFKLDSRQQNEIRTLLDEQRARLVTLVERAADAGSTLNTHSARETRNESVLAILNLAQRELWRTLAGQEPAEGVPVL